MRYRAAAVVLALAAAVAIGQVPMYSDYPWGLVNNGVDQGPVYNLDCRPPLVCTSPSYGNGRIQLGDGGVLDVVARYALDAGISNNVVCTRCILGDRLGLGAVGSLELGDLAVTTDKLNNLAVTEGKLGALAVTEGKLGALAVTEGKLGAGAVTNTKLADLAVSTGKLQDLSVQTGKLADLAVSTGKLADLSITEGKVAALAITEGKLGALSVTEGKLGAAAVTNAKLADLSISSGKLQDSAVVEAKLATGAVTNTKIGALAVDSAKLAAAAVTTAKIATGAVTSNELGAAAVTTAKIATGAVTSNELGAAAVTTAKLAAGAVDTTALGASAVTSAKLAAGAVDTTALGASAVTSAKLASGAVGSTALATGAVTSLKLAAGAVDSAALGTNAVTTTAISSLAVTASKLDDGIALSAYDEEGPAAISARASATNASEGTYSGEGYVRFTTTGTGVNLTSQVTTGLYTGTSTNLLTTRAVVRYRISGGWTAGGNVSMTAVNTANTAQTAAFTISTDGNWHTAVADISGWTTAGTLRIDVNGKPNGASYNDLSYIATGNPGSGTGALISSQGNVGMGTASPGTRLSVAPLVSHGAPSPGTASGGFSLLGNTNLYGLYAGVDSSGAVWWQAMRNDGTATAYPLWLNPSGGSVGIGTTSPSSATGYTFLTVQNTTNGGIIEAKDSTVSLRLQTSGIGAGDVGTYSNHPLRLLTNSSERLRISSSGLVGINNSVPKTWLDVQDDTASGTTAVMQWWSWTTTSPPSWGLHLDQIHTGSAIDYVFRTRNGSTADVNTLYLKANGNIGLNTTNPAERLHVVGNIRNSALAGVGNRAVYSDANGNLTNTASDATLKTAVEDLRSPLRMVLALRPVAYNWKDTERFGSQREIGFIAQEVMQVIPEVVGRNADGTYSVDYSKIVAALAGAVQELYDDRAWLARRVQALEDRAEAAEKRLTDLEARLAKLEAK